MYSRTEVANLVFDYLGHDLVNDVDASAQTNHELSVAFINNSKIVRRKLIGNNEWEFATKFETVRSYLDTKYDMYKIDKPKDMVRLINIVGYDQSSYKSLSDGIYFERDKKEKDIILLCGYDSGDFSLWTETALDMFIKGMANTLAAKFRPSQQFLSFYKKEAEDSITNEKTNNAQFRNRFTKTNMMANPFIQVRGRY